jgi:hypothetical protein
MVRTRNREPRTKNREPRTENRELRTGNQEPGTYRLSVRGAIVSPVSMDGDSEDIGVQEIQELNVGCMIEAHSNDIKWNAQ